MRTLDKDGRLLCELQGRIFEESAERYGTSSAVFIRRFMNSDYAARMDNEGAVDRPTDVQDAYDSLDGEYGMSQYGSKVLPADELFWMGYIYRCWAYVYELSSKAVYRTSSVLEMHALYYAYHTMDPLLAIERIMEAKGIKPQSEPESEMYLATAVQLLREIRNGKKSNKNDP